MNMATNSTDKMHKERSFLRSESQCLRTAARSTTSPAKGRASKGARTLLFVTFALVSGCSKEPPQGASIHADSDSGRLAQPAIATTDELIVYLDTSKSIQGYVAAGNKSVYSMSLRELRNVASLLDRPLQTWVRSVDADVGERMNDVALNRASTSVAIYQGDETNLASAIAQFGQPALIETTASGKQVSRIPLIHVLVTDGVQSTDSASNEADCDSGSDQVCVRAQLSRWLRAGWAGSLIGIRSEFRGPVYSEINHKIAGAPYKIAYASSPEDPKTMRPFYLYVFSPDAAALTEFIGKFKRRLRASVAGAVIRELPLNLSFAAGPASARVLTPPSGDIISVEGGHGVDTDRLTVRFDAHDARGNAGSSIALSVHIPWSPDALDMGTPRELGHLVAWSAVRRDGSKDGDIHQRIPQIRVGEPLVGGDGSIELPIMPAWPAGTGDRSWAIYAVRGVIRLDPDTPTWIREWSTDLDNAPEYGNRTLFLENAALGIWRSRNNPPEKVVEILVRVGP